jgi:hypothetical protein
MEVIMREFLENAFALFILWGTAFLFWISTP